MGAIFSEEAQEDSRKFTISQSGLQLDTAEDVAAGVAKLLEAKDQVAEVVLSKNSYGIEATQSIGNALSQCPGLQVVNLSDIFTGRVKSVLNPALRNLAEGLMPCRDLVELDLSDNAFGPDGVRAFSFLIEASPQLKVLKVNNNGLGVEGGSLLAAALLTCEGIQLTSFSAGRNRLEDVGTRELARAFRTMKSLRQISLYQNAIRGEGMVSLFEAFNECGDLQIIEIQDNFLSEESVYTGLAASLLKLQYVSILNIGDCNLQDEGAQAVLKALSQTSPHMLELHLEHNELSARSTADLLIELLPSKPQLEKVSLKGNEFDEETQQALLEAFEAVEKTGALDDFESEEEEV
jgi:Ran GTPase-activating protein 1